MRRCTSPLSLSSLSLSSSLLISLVAFCISLTHCLTASLPHCLTAHGTQVHIAAKLSAMCGDDEPSAAKFGGGAQVGLIVALRHRGSGQPLVAVTTHLSCNFQEPWTQVAQVKTLASHLSAHCTDSPLLCTALHCTLFTASCALCMPLVQTLHTHCICICICICILTASMHSHYYCLRTVCATGADSATRRRAPRRQLRPEHRSRDGCRSQLDTVRQPAIELGPAPSTPLLHLPLLCAPSLLTKPPLTNPAR